MQVYAAGTDVRALRLPILPILSRHGGRKDIAAMDMFAVPTILFSLRYRLLIMKHGRRQILWFGSQRI
jgi:hypothetical protein